MISMSASEAFLSWRSLVACMRCSSWSVPSGMSCALHHSSRRVMLLRARKKSVKEEEEEEEEEKRGEVEGMAQVSS